MNRTARSGKDTLFSIMLHDEILPALLRLDLAFYLAWSDTRTRYQRSVLGPFWLVLGTAVGVGGLGFVWSQLFNIDKAVFIPSLTVGLVTWYMLSSTITESAAVFYRNREMILNFGTSSLLISVQLLLRQIVNFAHNFIVVIVVLAIYPDHLGPTALLAIPGFILVLANLLLVIQIVGYIGARYRDLEPLLAAIMQPLFFITPVIFRPEQLGGPSTLLMTLNPFAWWLSLIRDPLFGNVPPASAWISCLILLAVCAVMAFTMTALKRRRLAYWVH